VGGTRWCALATCNSNLRICKTDFAAVFMDAESGLDVRNSTEILR
jgi:hypothetical protein